MIRLKRLLFDIELTQQDFARQIGWGYNSTWYALNGKFPVKKERFQNAVKLWLARCQKAQQWLVARDLTYENLWDVLPDEDLRHRWTDTRRNKMARRRLKEIHHPAIRPGNPNEVETRHKEAEMINPKAMRFFNLFRNPFINDISDHKDIYLSQDHIFLREMMLDTAKNTGFTAVTGEVGSGKSVMRKAIVQDLTALDIRVIYPLIVDKNRITPASLIDAVIMDVSEEKPKRSLEAKTRQARRLLRNRAASDMKQVLIVEEAHLLTVPAMKALKQIYELEDGFKKLISIILIGQPELRFLLDETRHPELREVSRRVTVAEITGLGKDLTDYLEHKFKRIGRSVKDFFDDDALAAIVGRLQRKDGKRISSKAYPLSINNMATRAINAAAQMGEKKITAELINNL
jgi:type II secretory pathway predicted ATPase ExeA